MATIRFLTRLCTDYSGSESARFRSDAAIVDGNHSDRGGRVGGDRSVRFWYRGGAVRAGGDGWTRLTPVDRDEWSPPNRQGTLFTPIPLPGVVLSDDGSSASQSDEAESNPESAVDVPEVDLPRVDAPAVRNPADDLPDFSSVDSAVSGPFLIAVVYANVALLGVSLGLMLVGFRGEWGWGGAAVVVGLFAAVRVYQTYRGFERRRAERAAGEDSPDVDADDSRTAEVD